MLIGRYFIGIKERYIEIMKINFLIFRKEMNLPIFTFKKEN